MELLKVLVTVKTYLFPSSKYDELVCTAGVLENGSFIRLYPINFRELPSEKKYRKYQWIEVKAEKYGRKDVRKESYRPDVSSIRLLGDPIPAGERGWLERSRYVLAQRARSLEDLRTHQVRDSTSLGIFRPKVIHDLVVSEQAPDWKASAKAELAQMRIWENRTVTRKPPRKVPWYFHSLLSQRSHRELL